MLVQAWLALPITMDINSGAIVDSFLTGAGKTLEYREPEAWRFRFPISPIPHRLDCALGLPAKSPAL
jgi:hypothetical protein